MMGVYGSGRGAPALVSIIAIGSYGSGLLSIAGGRVRQTMQRAGGTGTMTGWCCFGRKLCI